MPSLTCLQMQSMIPLLTVAWSQHVRGSMLGLKAVWIVYCQRKQLCDYRQWNRKEMIVVLYKACSVLTWRGGTKKRMIGSSSNHRTEILTGLNRGQMLYFVSAYLITRRHSAECRSQWPRSLRHEPSSSAPTLGSWVRITLEAWMSL
jgi:hypothetical protein